MYEFHLLYHHWIICFSIYVQYNTILSSSFKKGHTTDIHITWKTLLPTSHASILTWKIPWTEEPGVAHKESGMTEHTHTVASNPHKAGT